MKMPTLVNYRKLGKESGCELNFLKMNNLKQKLKIFGSFKKHFNPTSLVDSVPPEELSGNPPEFVREFQNISK